MLIDTHCHLDSSHFPEGPDAVLERARAEGVHHFIVIGVGETAESANNAVALSVRRPDVHATVGMHPHDASKLDDALERQLAELAAHRTVVAVGEVGLDYHYMHSTEPEQDRVFRKMIALAKTLRKPLVIHTRSAAQQTLDILEQENAREVGGVIHCFSEDRAFARRALDMDFDLSFSGIVTFKTAAAIQDVAAWAPAERILIETDSPYLAPIPRRGKRNEPANAAYTARHVAQLRQLPYDDLAKLSSNNAIRRFGLPLTPN